MNEFYFLYILFYKQSAIEKFIIETNNKLSGKLKTEKNLKLRNTYEN